VRQWAVKALEKLKNDDVLPSTKNKQMDIDKDIQRYTRQLRGMGVSI
jgi:hypothetical protein